MATTTVLSEIVIIGITANLGILFAIIGLGNSSSIPFSSALIKDLSTPIILLTVGFSYFSGNLVNVLSHKAFNQIDKAIRHELLGDMPYQLIRLKVYKASSELKSFLDVRYSILRLFRSSILAFGIMGLGFMIWRPSFLAPAQFYSLAILPFVLAALSFFAFKNQTRAFYKVMKNLKTIIEDAPKQTSMERDGSQLQTLEETIIQIHEESGVIQPKSKDADQV